MEDQNCGQPWGMASRNKAEVSQSPPGMDRSSDSSPTSPLFWVWADRPQSLIVRLRVIQADHS